MEITEDNDGNNELTRHEESWKVATSRKKRKLTSCTSGRKAVVADKKQWLRDITLRNSFNTLPEETVRDTTEKPTTRIAKPPSIYFHAKIIDPLIELPNNTGKDNYVIKRIKVDQMKVQTNTSDTFRKVTKSLNEKNAGYHTYQLKADERYKEVIRGLHPKTNTDNISEELAKIGHQVRSINNITRYDTKQALPLFLTELELKNNNKDIYEIKKVLNTIITVEPPRHKKDISQCIRCQQYGHIKNYCKRNSACVKCTENHLTVNCPNIGKINEVKCFNSDGNQSVSYKGCVVRKQLQRKLFPSLGNKTYNNLQAQQDSTKTETTPNSQHAMNINHSNTNTFGSRSYAQIISQSSPSDNQNHNTISNGTTEIKELLKQSIKNTEMLTRMISE